jgi:ribosomal protein S9
MARIPKFVKELTDEEKILVQIRDDAFDGDWEAMRGAMLHRLSEQPYILKLADRIKRDLVVIEKLRSWERKKQGRNIARYLPGGEWL